MRSSSLQALRALLAVAMAALFYAIVLGVLALVVRHLVGKWSSPSGFDMDYGDFLLTLSALAIPWALWPRRDEFIPPGPRLEPAAHPALFRMLEEVAAAAGQPMPEEVYLMGDFNAWVREAEGPARGRSRSVMAIGYPLFLALPPAPLRAILAHEFGHYHGGDTRNALRFYRVDRVLVRTVNGLRFFSGYVWLPFWLYYRLFRTVTMAVSRRQELAADRLAASIAGPEAMGTGLSALHSLAPPTNGFWESDMKAILDAGVRPPLLEGLRRALRNPLLRKAAEDCLAEARTVRRAKLTDSHPTLPQRLAALGVAAEPTVPSGEEDSAALLGPVDHLEDALLGKRDRGKLEAVPWEEVGERVEIPELRKLVARNRRALRGLTPSDMPTRKRDVKRIARRTKAGWPGLLDHNVRKHTASLVLGGALLLLLREKGWTFEWYPGEPLVCHRDGVRVHPYRVVDDLIDGTLPLEEWLRTAESIGIAHESLEAVAARAAQGKAG